MMRAYFLLAESEAPLRRYNFTLFPACNWLDVHMHTREFRFIHGIRKRCSSGNNAENCKHQSGQNYPKHGFPSLAGIARATPTLARILTYYDIS